MGALVRTVAATVPVVTTAEAKQHMRVDLPDDDDLIDNLVQAATNTVENLTGRSLLEQTWKWLLDVFPGKNELLIPRARVISVASLKSTDQADVQTLFAAANYIVDIDSEPGRLVKRIGVSWPANGGLREANAVEMIFKAGYGNTSATVPRDLRQAVLMLAGHFYENRETTISMDLKEIPFGVRALVAPYAAWDQFFHARVHADIER